MMLLFEPRLDMRRLCIRRSIRRLLQRLLRPPVPHGWLHRHRDHCDDRLERQRLGQQLLRRRHLRRLRNWIRGNYPPNEVQQHLPIPPSRLKSDPPRQRQWVPNHPRANLAINDRPRIPIQTIIVASASRNQLLRNSRN